MSFKIAVSTLNQWALDFEGNTHRIIQSIEEAVRVGAIYRAGPELEISGYSLEDAFFEEDTIAHCWDCLAKIIEHTCSLNIVIDVGMPVRNDATSLIDSKPIFTLYNCRVLLYKGKILCIRAKTRLAGEGNYREPRFFKPWPDDVGTVPFKLPMRVASRQEDVFVPLGADFAIELVQQNGSSLRLGWEICQELWETNKASSSLYQNFGCHLVLNGSGSYWELRKLNIVHEMIETITRKAGACYAYSNLVGCDGQRYVFFGRSCIFDRGQLRVQASNPGDIFEDVQVISYTINPSEIDEHRSQNGIVFGKSHPSRWNLLDAQQKNPSQLRGFSGIFSLNLDGDPTLENSPSSRFPALGNSFSIGCFQEEIYYYVSLWLWDYLRRSKMKGFMLPLSGGLDSSTVAVLVYCMCNILFERLDKKNVQEYFRHCHGIQSEDLKSSFASPAAICGLLLRCRYLSTQYSGRDTEERAKVLASSIGANFEVVSIQHIYSQCKALEQAPKLDGSQSAALLDQNVQARLRMVATYYLSDGNRIVLASGNVDEAIMGYLTKYDCSSADINPIGGLCKRDLESFVHFARSKFAQQVPLVDILGRISKAPPSAELTGAEQRDEDDMGITYDEISVLGRVRRGIYGNCGPKGAFVTVWKRRNEEPFKTKIRCLRDCQGSGQKTAGEVATDLGDLIKRFYKRYSNNRHKQTVLTPALHAETYSPDDNRFDHRQFLYPSMGFQFKFVDELVEQVKTFGDFLS